MSHQAEARDSDARDSAFAELKLEHRDAKRRLIESAAARVFARKGYRHATIADVAAEAGVSAGAIYIYFASREELLFAAVLAEIDALESLMRASIDQTAPADRVLRSMMAGYFEFFTGHTEGFRMLTAGLDREARLKAAPDLVAQYDEKALRCLTLLHDVIERGIAEGSFRPGDAWELTHALWGACHGLLAVAVAQDPDRFVGFEVKRLFERATDALLVGLTNDGKGTGRC